MSFESDSERERSGRSPSDEAPNEARDDEPATILVVDDELYARQLLTDLLEAQGFDVVSVARGEEAFSWIGVVDLVLLDAMLPGRDGWAICRELKQEYDPLLPIIMVTARTTPEDVVRTFEAGADDYVAKPFQARELTARIESRLRVRRAERDLQRMNHRLAELANQNYQLYEKARSDADERSRLLNELDHRVRNNLSVIMGLVGMERNRRPPRPSAEALWSLESRLRSFLTVLEALRRQNFRSVPVREIAEKLAQRLRNSMIIDGRVQIAFEGQAAPLNERQGFALGLALNELITNAFEHGFPDGRAGTVRIRVADGDDDVRVEIVDDGIGMADAPEGEVVGSGRSIVEALVRGDLAGTVEYLPTDRGTRVRVCFPRDPATAR